MKKKGSCFMRVSREAVYDDGSEWFDPFQSAYTTRSQRLALARDVAWPITPSAPPNQRRPSYNALAALWGDDLDALRLFCNSLGRLYALGKKYSSQNIAVFTEGSPAAINMGTGSLDADVTMHVGTIKPTIAGTEHTGQMYYGYAGKSLSKDPNKDKNGVGLVFDVGLTVARGSQRIRARRQPRGLVSVSVKDLDTDHVNVFDGAVSLSGDPEDYFSCRRLTESELVIGNVAVNQLLRDLTLVEDGTASDNWRHAKPPIDMNEPVVDLAEIFPLENVAA